MQGIVDTFIKLIQNFSYYYEYTSINTSYVAACSMLISTTAPLVLTILILVIFILLKCTRRAPCILHPVSVNIKLLIKLLIIFLWEEWVRLVLILMKYILNNSKFNFKYSEMMFYLIPDDTREQNGKILPNISSSSCNESSSTTELVPINGSSNTNSNNSNYYAVYSNSPHLTNTANSAGVGMSSCYSTYPSNYSAQQLYPPQVILLHLSIYEGVIRLQLSSGTKFPESSRKCYIFEGFVLWVWGKYSNKTEAHNQDLLFYISTFIPNVFVDIKSSAGIIIILNKLTHKNQAATF